MNKKVIAMAVTAALAAPMAAQADVTVYGKMYAQMAGASLLSNPNDDQSTGRLGFKVSEDMGNGMTAHGQYEYGIDVADTSGGSGLRLSHIGVKASWGDLSFGTFDSAYKTTGGVKIDPFVATALQARGNGGMSASGRGALGHNGYNYSVMQYQNKFGAVAVNLQYATGSYDSSATDTITNDTTNGDYSLGLKMKAGGVNIGVALASEQGGAASGQKLAVDGKAGSISYAFQYETAGNMYLNVGFGFGASSTAYLAYGDGGYTVVGGVTKLSKATHVLYGYDVTNSNAMVGLKTSF